MCAVSLEIASPCDTHEEALPLILQPQVGTRDGEGHLPSEIKALTKWGKQVTHILREPGHHFRGPCEAGHPARESSVCLQGMQGWGLWCEN